MPSLDKIKLYHILHIDRIESIATDGFLWCDRQVMERGSQGTTIGMGGIKARRLNELTLASHPDLFVGDCVPFYFCPRSIMLYMIYRGNSLDLGYKDGQESIVHLEFDLHSVVDWCQKESVRWAFTLGNAGSHYFEDRANLNQLNELDWQAISATNWAKCKEAKQAEFLVERQIPYNLISRIGVLSNGILEKVEGVIAHVEHKPAVELMPSWYY